jgi:hypothetical protein
LFTFIKFKIIVLIFSFNKLILSNKIEKSIMFNYKNVILKKIFLYFLILLLSTFFFYIIFLSININLYKTTILVKNFRSTDFNKYDFVLRDNTCYSFKNNSNSNNTQDYSNCYNLDFQRLLSDGKNFNDFVDSYENSDLIKNYLKKNRISIYNFFIKNLEKNYFDRNNNQIIKYSFYLPEDLKEINLLEDYLIFTSKELNKNYKEDLIVIIDMKLNDNIRRYQASQAIYNNPAIRKDFLFSEKFPPPEIINLENNILIEKKKDLIKNGFLVNLQYNFLEKNKSNFSIKKFHKLFFSFILGLLLSMVLINFKNFFREFKKQPF